MASEQGNYQLFSVMDIELPGIQWFEPEHYMSDTPEPEVAMSRAALIVADLLDTKNVEDCKAAIKAVKKKKRDLAVIILWMKDQEQYEEHVQPDLAVAQALFNAGADDVVFQPELIMASDDEYMAARDVFLAIELALLRKGKFDNSSKEREILVNKPEGTPTGTRPGSRRHSKDSSGNHHIAKIQEVQVQDLQKQIRVAHGRISELEAREYTLMMQLKEEAEQMDSINDQVDMQRAQLNYLHWQWIPNQLQLKLGKLDKHLVERDDGTVGSIRYIKDLGKGVFGQVHLGCTSESEHVAVKVMYKENAKTIVEVERAYREIQILTQIPVLDHLVRYLGVMHSIDAVYLILSYGGPINLYTMQCELPRYKFSIEVASLIFEQIAGVVATLHGLSIFHRDIKPENIAVKEEGKSYNATLVDCGMAVKTKKLICVPAGSMPFAAPEILDEDCRYNGGPADAFALGMLLFEMIRGLGVMHDLLGWPIDVEASPHRAYELRNLLRNGVPEAGKEPEESKAFTKALQGLLHIDAGKRATVADTLASGVFAPEKMRGA
jgi:hypothetical protein